MNEWSTIAQTIDQTNPARRVIGLSLLALSLLGLLLATSVHAQSEHTYEHYFSVQLDDHEQEVADEYLEILEELSEVVTDYVDYLDDLGPAERQAHRINVERLQKGLQSGVYLKDHDLLLEEIDELIDEIKVVENSHKAAVNSAKPQCCRVVRNLRRELLVIAEVAEDYIDGKVGHILKDEKLQRYFQEATKNYTALIELTTKQIEASLRYIDLPGELTVLSIPPAPAPSSPFVQLNKPRQGEVGMSHNFTAKVTLEGSDSRIRATNPSGCLHITGWDKPQISASLTIEVLSGDRDREKQFISGTDLSISSSGNMYTVSAAIPKVSDPETRILSSMLVIKVPRGSPIQANNAFGSVQISDIAADLSVISNHSKIVLSEIDGAVSVTNSSGGIFLEDIIGTIQARNSDGKIVITDCRGEITVDNQFSHTILTDTEGKTHIRSTGEVTVNGHDGELTVENNYGTVTIVSVLGNVTVSNTYQPILVNEVLGDVHLTNVYSTIKGLDIEGDLFMENNSGAIRAENPSGVLTIDNKNGDVFVILDRTLSGKSSVVTTHGTINVYVADEADLRVTASAVHGQITATVPITVIDQGREQTADVKFGRASELLALSGNNVAIVINKH